MGYFARIDGDIAVTKEPEAEAKKLLADAFDYVDYSLFKNEWRVLISNSDKYHEDVVYEALNALNDIAISGELECAGEDGCLWRISYKDGKWTEENGTTVYNKDEALKAFPPVPDNERCEFVGQIIDIFEDFLEEKGITISNPEKDEDDEENAAIIYGSDYGIIQDALELMMRNWKITEEEK